MKFAKERAAGVDRPGGHPYTVALIVAAGRSVRMGADKMWLPIDGVPVIERTLLAFEQAATVDETVVVTRAEEIARLQQACSRRGIRKLTGIVAGGETRQQSVCLGIRSVTPRAEFFCIHDGARPLVRPARIDEVNAMAYRTGAAALAVPVKDTIKLADADGLVRQTPDRASLWQVQTPQVFESRQYAEALELAQRRQEDMTDDCQLMERMGRPVRLCPGDYTNIKLTTPEDVWIAQAILREGTK